MSFDLPERSPLVTLSIVDLNPSQVTRPCGHWGNWSLCLEHLSSARRVAEAVLPCCVQCMWHELPGAHSWAEVSFLLSLEQRCWEVGHAGCSSWQPPVPFLVTQETPPLFDSHRCCPAAWEPTAGGCCGSWMRKC